MCLHQALPCFGDEAINVGSYVRLGCKYIYMYSGAPLMRTLRGPGELSRIERCPHFRGKFTVFLGHSKVSSIQRCPYTCISPGVSFRRGSTVICTAKQLPDNSSHGCLLRNLLRGPSGAISITSRMGLVTQMPAGERTHTHQQMQSGVNHPTSRQRVQELF